MCLQTFHGVEKTPLFYYNNQHQEKRFGGSKKGIRFSKKFFETHRKPHGYWVPVISVTKDKPVRFSYGFIFCLIDKFIPLAFHRRQGGIVEIILQDISGNHQKSLCSPARLYADPLLYTQLSVFPARP